MDENKRKKLIDIGYEIHKTCSLCIHSRFNGQTFGDCIVQTYYHKKHEDTKQLSIHESGSCPKFEIDPIREMFMHKFSEFIK